MIETLLLTAARIFTFVQQRRLTNASGFFFARDARLFLVIEHRSHQDPGLHDTLVRYSVHLAHGPRRKRSSPPTPVLAVVLYHGPGSLDLRPQHPKRIASVLGGSRGRGVAHALLNRTKRLNR